jgi:hypothetical protein
MIEIRPSQNDKEIRFCVDQHLCYRVDIPSPMGKLVNTVAYKIQKTELYVSCMQELEKCKTEDIKYAAQSPTSLPTINEVIQGITPPEPIVVEVDRVEKYIRIKNTLNRLLDVGRGSYRIMNQLSQRLRH